MLGLSFGFVLFMVDLLLIAVVFRWLWHRGVSRGRVVVMLVIGKLAILGGGVYLSLVVYRVDALLFVIGSLLALLIFSLVFYHRQYR